LKSGAFPAAEHEYAAEEELTPGWDDGVAAAAWTPSDARPE
jgi:hypothetical protein